MLLDTNRVQLDRKAIFKLCCCCAKISFNGKYETAFVNDVYSSAVMAKNKIIYISP